MYEIARLLNQYKRDPGTLNKTKLVAFTPDAFDANTTRAIKSTPSVTGQSSSKQIYCPLKTAEYFRQTLKLSGKLSLRLSVQVFILKSCETKEIILIENTYRSTIPTFPNSLQIQYMTQHTMCVSVKAAISRGETTCSTQEVTRQRHMDANWMV